MVVIFDLLALFGRAEDSPAGRRSAADRLIGRLFDDVRVLKVGFEFPGDLQKLHASYPRSKVCSYFCHRICFVLHPQCLHGY